MNFFSDFCSIFIIDFPVLCQKCFVMFYLYFVQYMSLPVIYSLNMPFYGKPPK